LLNYSTLEALWIVPLGGSDLIQVGLSPEGERNWNALLIAS
jgi:hypothetical protein